MLFLKETTANLPIFQSTYRYHHRNKNRAKISPKIHQSKNYLEKLEQKWERISILQAGY